MEERILDYFRDKPREMLYADDIAAVIADEEGISSEEALAEMEGRLMKSIKNLAASGRLVISKRGRVGLPSAFGMQLGEVLINDKGYAFFRPLGAKSDRKDDVFISKSKMRGALHRDTVLVKVENNRRGSEALIERIVRRSSEIFVGTFSGLEIAPNDKKMYRRLIVASNPVGAVPGDVVSAKVVSWNNDDRPVRVEITEVLGRVGDKGLDILAVAKQFGLEARFPDLVLAEAAALPSEIVSDGRCDYRALPTVTIDGADAKDIDDAISLEILPSAGELLDGAHGKVYRLYVHIADVSHYVRPGTALDDEAFARGTSSYLVDRVIPMLPERLSNDLCSLNAGADRYALTCVMDFDEAGELKFYNIVKSIINVDARLEYGGVSKFLDNVHIDASEKSDEALANNFGSKGDLGSDAEVRKCEPFGAMLAAMAELSGIIRAGRMARGAVNFDFPEAEIRLDSEGFPVEISRRERDAASLIIEDFMLAANETVAEHYYWLEKPFVYRVHEAPSQERIEQLKKYTGYFGLKLKGKDENVGIAQLIDEIRGTAYEAAVAREALRSMMQARYSEDNLGHFGLASKYYCHFTAPIRRYPDLFIHRIISADLADSANDSSGGLESGLADSVNSGISINRDMCAKVAAQASEREQNAENAERKVTAMKMAEYMEGHIGELFEGVISSVMSYGIFVQLDNLVEGLVHISLMPPDEYDFDEDMHTLTALRRGEVYSIGDRVEVLVAAANELTGKVDFSLVADFEKRVFKSNKRNSKSGARIVEFDNRAEHRGEHRERESHGKHAHGGAKCGGRRSVRSADGGRSFDRSKRDNKSGESKAGKNLRKKPLSAKSSTKKPAGQNKRGASTGA